MKISILLPYKENFSPIYAGAVSLFVKDTTKLSRYKEHITVYGNTKLKKIYKLNQLRITNCNWNNAHRAKTLRKYLKLVHCGMIWQL